MRLSAKKKVKRDPETRELEEWSQRKQQKGRHILQKAEWINALTAPSMDQGLDTSTHIRWFINACNSSSKGSDAPYCSYEDVNVHMREKERGRENNFPSLFHLFVLYCVYECFAQMYVYAPWACLRREHWVLWKQSCRWLWATMLGLGIELRSSGRASQCS